MLNDTCQTLKIHCSKEMGTPILRNKNYEMRNYKLKAVITYKYMTTEKKS